MKIKLILNFFVIFIKKYFTFTKFCEIIIFYFFIKKILKKIRF